MANSGGVCSRIGISSLVTQVELLALDHCSSMGMHKSLLRMTTIDKRTMMSPVLLFSVELAYFEKVLGCQMNSAIPLQACGTRFESVSLVIIGRVDDDSSMTSNL